MDAAEIRIPFSKLQLAWRALGVLGLAWLCVDMTIAHGERVYLIVVGPLGFVLCAWMAITYMGRLVSRKPAVLVTPEWIVNRSSFGAVAIMWQDIAMLFLYQERRQQYIAIVPYNLREIVERQAPLTRLQLSLIRRFSPMPIKIWVSVLPVTTDELWSELREYANFHVPHLAEDLFQEESGSRQAENESDVVSPAAETPAPAGVQPEGEGTIRDKKPSVITVTTAGKILPLAIPMLGIVALVHTVIPAFEVAGYVITLAIASVLMLGVGVLKEQSFDRLLWLSLVFGTGSFGFAIAHGWFEGAIMTFAVIVTTFLIATMIVLFRVGRFLRHVNDETEADLRDLQHWRGH